MAAMALPFLIASQVVSAVGSVRSGNAAANAANANASNLEATAGAVRRQTVLQEEQSRAEARQVIGKQLAAGAESGVSLSGSNLDVLRQSLTNSESDALNIRYGGEVNARNLQSRADIMRYEGRQSRMSGYLSAAGSMLNAGASYFGGSTLPTQKQLIHAGGL